MYEDTISNIFNRIIAIEARLAKLEPPVPEPIPLDQLPFTVTEEFPDDNTSISDSTKN